VLKSGERLSYLRQLAKIMTRLHEQESHHPLVHRDIKPENVLVDSRNDTLVLIDFGFARFQNSLGYVDTSCKTAGTKDYRAPEAQDDGSLLTYKMDVYSFGVMMVEVMTGKRPQSPIDSVHPLPEFSPDSVRALATQCLSIDPQIRPDFEAIQERLRP